MIMFLDVLFILRFSSHAQVFPTIVLARTFVQLLAFKVDYVLRDSLRELTVAYGLKIVRGFRILLSFSWDLLNVFSSFIWRLRILKNVGETVSVKYVS